MQKIALYPHKMMQSDSCEFMVALSVVHGCLKCSSWLPLVNENKASIILLVTVFKSKMYTKLKCVLNLHELQEKP